MSAETELEDGTHDVMTLKGISNGWDVVDAICEFLRNARDAEVADEHMAEVFFDNFTHTAIITTYGCHLLPHSFKFGHSTRSPKSPDTFGHRGEGLKWACLALLRAGCKVEFQGTGADGVQRFYSAYLNPDCAIGCGFIGGPAKNEISSPCPLFRVRVSGVSPEQWKAAAMSCDWLRHYVGAPALPVPDVRTSRGSVYLGKSGLTVNGYEVRTPYPLFYRYSLKGVHLTREANLPPDFNLIAHIRGIWKEAFEKQPLILKEASDHNYLNAINGSNTLEEVVLLPMIGSTPAALPKPKPSELVMSKAALMPNETLIIRDACEAIVGAGLREALMASIQVVALPEAEGFVPCATPKGHLQIPLTSCYEPQTAIEAILLALGSVEIDGKPGNTPLKQAVSALWARFADLTK
jgi:hypothetical protein